MWSSRRSFPEAVCRYLKGTCLELYLMYNHNDDRNNDDDDDDDDDNN